MNIIKFIKDLIAPKKCYSCNKEGHFLCQECVVKLTKFEPLCYVCKNRSYNFEVDQACKKGIFYDKIIIFTHYRQKFVKKMIKDLKFYHKKDIAEDLGAYIGTWFLDHESIKNNEEYIIIPTPMYFLRQWMRGYNHAEELTNYVSKTTGIKRINVIKKLKNTNQQSKNSKTERLNNLQNSFGIRKHVLKKIYNKKIILVDDVVSTGTTINKISQLLKSHGAQEVIGLVIASD